MRRLCAQLGDSRLFRQLNDKLRLLDIATGETSTVPLDSAIGYVPMAAAIRN